jgi:xanthine dehydrogenase accessory factor
MDVFAEIVAVKNAGIPAVLATVIEASGSAPRKAGARMLIKADGSIVGTIGGGAIEKRIMDEALALMQGGAPKIVRYELEEIGMSCGGSMSTFLEPLQYAAELIIFGAGHIGAALSKIGNMMEFSVTVIDNRKEFAAKEKFPWAARVIANDYQETLSELVFSDNTYIVIVTHKHIHDVEILEYCAQRSFRYLGMIGSRTKVGKAFQQLRDKGIDEEIIQRIHAPIGIGIGANTPAEIALSIAAELVAVRSETEVKGLKMGSENQ